MKTKNSKRFGYLSTKTMRVFGCFNDAHEDAKLYCKLILNYTDEQIKKDINKLIKAVFIYI